MASIFEDVDPLDIDDALTTIERSFNIQFEQQDLDGLKTFGELTDHIIAKMQLAEGAGCTTQQAFYKLRDAVLQLNISYHQPLSPETPLRLLFPRKDRRTKIAKLESILGFKATILEPSSVIAISMVVFFFASFGYLLINWIYGMIGMAASALVIYIDRKTTKQFAVPTLGELAEKIRTEHYLKARRNSSTVNRAEIYPIVEQIFDEALCLDKGVLHRDASLV